MRTMQPKHYRALDLLMLGQSDDQVAGALGLKAAKTIKRWKAAPLFQAEWNKRREQLIQQGADRAKMMVGHIQDTLLEMMQDGPPRVRVEAAWYAHRMLMEMDERMEASATSHHTLIVPVDDLIVSFLLRQYGSRESAGEAFASLMRKAALENVQN